MKPGSNPQHIDWWHIPEISHLQGGSREKFKVTQLCLEFEAIAGYLRPCLHVKRENPDLEFKYWFCLNMSDFPSLGLYFASKVCGPRGLGKVGENQEVKVRERFLVNVLGAPSGGVCGNLTTIGNESSFKDTLI